MDYNGWHNYETWNVNLWLGNDEGTDRALWAWLKENPDAGAADLACFVRGLLPYGTPDFDDVSDYRLVNWEELLRAYRAGS